LKILCADIETKPHTAYLWDLKKQYIPVDRLIETGGLLCASWKWHNEDKLHFASEWDDGHVGMMARIHDAIDEADAVVTYNGKKFDEPILRQEFLKYGMPPPSPVKSIDLYQTVRRQFRFASNKLDHVCQQLGLGSKVKHEGMELWVKVMAGDKIARRKMTEYNKGDVVLLEKLYDYLRPWIQGHPNYTTFTEEHAAVCSTCGSSHLQRRGFAVTRSVRYKRYQCQDCGTWGRERVAEKEKPLIVGVE
jgi:DNA polymerase elongation subunit (family B)